MKTHFSSHIDYIISHSTIKKPDAAPIPSKDGKSQFFELVREVDKVTFYSPVPVEIGEPIYKKVTLSKQDILALADKIQELEAEPVPNGIPSYDDDDLPF